LPAAAACRLPEAEHRHLRHQGEPCNVACFFAHLLLFKAAHWLYMLVAAEAATPSGPGTAGSPVQLSTAVVCWPRCAHPTAVVMVQLHTPPSSFCHCLQGNFSFTST
jgi:hypothetical protein